MEYYELTSSRGEIHTKTSVIIIDFLLLPLFIACSTSVKIWRAWMALKSAARSFIRQLHLSTNHIPAVNLTKNISSSGIFTAWGQASPEEKHHIASPIRAFSTTRFIRYAAVEESVDFREQDRESNEVDVCIVGGGNSAAHLLTDFVDLV